MLNPYLAGAVSFVLGVALTLAVVGWQAERRERGALAGRVAELERRREQSGNHLYWEAIEDERARLIQLVLRLQAVKADMRGWENEIEVALALLKGK